MSGSEGRQDAAQERQGRGRRVGRARGEDRLRQALSRAGLASEAPDKGGDGLAGKAREGASARGAQPADRDRDHVEERPGRVGR